jgi:hypothetical protein
VRQPPPREQRRFVAVANSRFYCAAWMAYNRDGMIHAAGELREAASEPPRAVF